MSHKGEVSNYHRHKDRSSGWDVNIKSNDGHGSTDHKMHAVDQTGVDKGETEGFLSGVADAVGSIFDAIFGGKNK